MDAIVGAGKVATVNAADFQTMPPSMVVTLAFHVPVGALKGTTTVPLIVVAVTVHHHNCVVQYGTIRRIRECDGRQARLEVRAGDLERDRRVFRYHVAGVTAVMVGCAKVPTVNAPGLLLNPPPVVMTYSV